MVGQGVGDLVADPHHRVEGLEGVLEDLGRGHVPNIPSELGWKAEWKHNRKGLLTRLAAGSILFLVVISYLRRNKAES